MRGTTMQTTTFNRIYDIVKHLKAEGIEFVDGRVDMKKYQWNQVTLEMLENMDN